MIELAALLWGMALVFGIVGYVRGLNKELISLAGIILALFALFQFDDIIRGVLLANVPADQRFYVQLIIFLIIVFFAYQTRALQGRVGGAGGNANDGRDNLQSTALGALVGLVNGYLIWGSIWYFMDINGYPLDPYIARPATGTASASLVPSLPLYLLAGGPGGEGNLLALAVILLFIFVLIII